MDRSLDPNAPVLVTGATGYVAGWVVKELLDRGHTVHAAVRDPAAGAVAAGLVLALSFALALTWRATWTRPRVAGAFAQPFM